MPDAVDIHTGPERVGRVNNLLGKLKPAAGAVSPALSRSTEKSRSTTFDLGSKVGVRAAEGKTLIATFKPVIDRPGGRLGGKLPF
jgi:hypothetical protein